jgi:hypothetical protein
VGVVGEVGFAQAPAAWQVKGRGTMRTYFVDAPMEQDMAVQDVLAEPSVVAHPKEATMQGMVAQNVKAKQATVTIAGQIVLAKDAMIGYLSQHQLRSEASQLNPIIPKQLLAPSNMPPSEAERI